MKKILLTSIIISAAATFTASAEMNLFQQSTFTFAPQASAIHRAAADGEEVQTVPYYEGFEGWDGISFDWIPAGWADVSKSDPPHTRPAEDWTLNFTWQVEGSSWGDSAPEGKYMARIGNAFYTDPDNPNRTIFEEQDEWLISPKVALTDHNMLYFQLGLHPGWLFINPSTMKFDRVNNIMEVHISDDGGDTWTKLWDCLEAGQQFSDDELWASMSSLKSNWIKARIDLSEYAGKTVQVAFRYVGVEGESMLLDAVAIRQPSPIAQYMAPSGMFYSGYSMDYATADKATMLYGTDKTATWTNVSNIDCQQFIWAYVDGSGRLQRDEDENLEFYCRPGTMSVPMLTASADYADDSSFSLPFDHVQFGGELADGVGACNFDLSRSVGSFQSGDTYIFGNNGNDFWSRAVTATGYNVSLEAYCNYFPAPNHSYSISKVWINAWADLEPEAELTVDLLTVSASGGVSEEPLASAICKAADVVYHTDADSTVYASLPFDFGKRITIDGALIVRIYGFDGPGVKSLQFLHQYLPNTDGANFAYVQLSASNSEKTVSELVSAAGITTQYGSMSTALCVNMDVNFSRLECSDRSFNAGCEASAKGFRFTTDYAGDDVSVSGDGVGDWITYSVKELDTATSVRVITLSLSENSGGARSSEVTVAIPGSYVKLNVSQSQAASIADVNVSEQPSARFIGNELRINNAAGSTAQIFSATGALLTSQYIATEGLSLDASLWPAGIYIIKFDNNHTQKLIKQ